MFRMFYVEKKSMRAKRYKQIVYFSESIKECRKFIMNEIEKNQKDVYRIVDPGNALMSRPISFSNKLLEDDI